MSAMGNVHTEMKKSTSISVVKNNASEKNQTKKLIRIYNWVQVTSPCGAVYYLDLNDYSSQNELMGDVYYFNGQKCNGNTGMNPIV